MQLVEYLINSHFIHNGTKNPTDVKLRKCDILGKVLARFGFDASNMFQKSWHNKRLEK